MNNYFGYQIYIKSFKDSNNDGIGDLNGINEKLDYLQDLGVNLIWICPFYDSPMDDNGYDIRNYCKVDQTYGNIDDLKSLIKEAHKRNIKVIADLVMNHTSIENEWFTRSENREQGYENLYIWKDPKIVNGEKTYPNNWQSFFSGPAWKYSEKRGQYFLRIFSEKMPDINYENKKAFEEMTKVIEFYAKLGIDGFRLDAIAHLGKDPSFKDAKNKKKTYLSFSNLSNTHEYLKRFYRLFTKNKMVTFGELGGNPTKKDMIKYTTDELSSVFCFEQFGSFNKDNTINKGKLLKSLKYKSELGKVALFWLNHDYPRLISKIKNEGDPKNAQLCLATLMYLLKGTPFIYNGEEIGMTNYNFKSKDDFKDVNAKMMFENSKDEAKTLEYLKESSRDNARTIMQWDKSTNAGFSNTTPWIYVNDNYREVNVEEELKDENSMLNNYKKIIKTRNSLSNIIGEAKYKFIKTKGLLGYKITTSNEEYLVIANINNKDKKYAINGETLYSNKEVTRDTIKAYQCMIIKNK